MSDTPSTRPPGSENHPAGTGLTAPPPVPNPSRQQRAHVVRVDGKPLLYTAVLTTVISTDGTLRIYGVSPKPKYARRRPAVIFGPGEWTSVRIEAYVA